MTSFHHQPEAQHPKSSAIHNYVGRLPHLCANSGQKTDPPGMFQLACEKNRLITSGRVQRLPGKGRLH